MTRKNSSQKEQFVSPRVTEAVGIELEEKLLVNSPGTEMSSLILATGHDTYNYETTSDFNGEYWE